MKEIRQKFKRIDIPKKGYDDDLFDTDIDLDTNNEEYEEVYPIE